MSRGSGARPRRRTSAGHARRPRRPLRQRLRGRLPSASRALAGLLLVALVAGFIAVLNGPWLRVARVASAGTHFTAASELEALVAPYRGSSLLTVDGEALRDQLLGLPAVSEASVTANLPDLLEVSITEKPAAFSWLTRSSRLAVAADGSVLAALPRDAEVPDELADLPLVDDDRSASRKLGVGGVLPGYELEMAQRLLGLDPKLLGSAATGFTLRVDDEYGFILVSASPAWRAALGFYRLDPEESIAAADARLDEQVTAIRTLFGSRAEAGVSWVDVRNPGKVYWAQ